jgi:siroheme synthase-like protein
LECDAAVSVISPTLTPVVVWADEGRFLAEPPLPARDLKGAFLVFAERSDPQLMRCLEEASGNILVNVIDDTEHCNFIAGSVVRRGPLVISISTSGAALHWRSA